VVSAEQVDVLRTAEKVRVQEEDDLGGKAAAVDVVPEEEKRGSLRVAAELEHRQKIVELAVEVADDDHRGGNSQHVWALAEDVGGEAEDTEGGLWRQSALVAEVAEEKRDVRERGLVTGRGKKNVHGGEDTRFGKGDVSHDAGTRVVLDSGQVGNADLAGRGSRRRLSRRKGHQQKRG
jgi:hypothetical protein